MTFADVDATMRSDRPDLTFGQRTRLITAPDTPAQSSLRVYPEACIKRGQSINAWKSHAKIFGTPVVLNTGLRTDGCTFLRHPSLECVLGVTQSGELISEYFTRGSAAQLKQPPPSITLRLLLGICAALEFLRSRGLSGRGRGLTLEDVFITSSWEAKISQRLLLLPDSPDANGDVTGVQSILKSLLPDQFKSNTLSSELHALLGFTGNFNDLFQQLRTLAKRDSDFADEAVQAFVLGV